VVSTYHGGIPELILDNQSGLLVKERDVKRLTKCIKYFIENSDMRVNFAYFARGLVERGHNIDAKNIQLELLLGCLLC